MGSLILDNSRIPHGMRPEVLGILPNIPSSIRAPTWDTTGSDRHLHPSSLRFNPRVPHGTRRGTYSSGRIPAAVSIHAPAEGATAQGLRQHPGIESFNPRARGGRDASDFRMLSSSTEFQSTRPRRARPTRRTVPPSYPRVSIHAPAEGATLQALIGRRAAAVSIHAPAEGATRTPWRHTARTPWFQSTRPRRARPLLRNHLWAVDRFQSTRPRRARLVCAQGARDDQKVSIHAPAEGATQSR